MGWSLAKGKERLEQPDKGPKSEEKKIGSEKSPSLGNGDAFLGGVMSAIGL